MYTYISEKGLSDVILKDMYDIRLNTNYLTGQGYDEASSMSRRYYGVQKYIRDKHSVALYLYCSSHYLNLVITFSCNIHDIRKYMGTM